MENCLEFCLTFKPIRHCRASTRSTTDMTYNFKENIHYFKHLQNLIDTSPDTFFVCVWFRLF